MNIIKLVNFIALLILSEDSKQISRTVPFKGFTEVRTFIKTEIIHDDNIGCSDEYIKFSRELLMSRYNIKSDFVVFKCDTILDHKGIRHTKRYKEIKIIIL